MDRKGILGITLAIIGFVSFQIYYQRATLAANKARQEAAELAAANAPKVSPADPGTATAPAIEAPVAAAPAAPDAPVAAPVEPTVPAQSIKFTTPTVEYTFSNLGGGITTAKLRNHNAENGAKIILNQFGTLPIGFTSEVAGEGVQVPFRVEANTEAGEIRFERLDSRKLQTTKKFILPKLVGADKATLLREEYLIRMDLTLTNTGTEPLQLPAYFIHTGSAAPIHQRDMPAYTGFNHYANGKSRFEDVTWFDGGGFFSRRPASPVYSIFDKIRWAGVTNQYFTSLVSPIIDDKANSDVQAAHFGTQVWSKRIVVGDKEWQAAGHSMEGKGDQQRFGLDGALGMPGITLQPGESRNHSFNLFTGPREYARLKALGNQEDEIMNFGWSGIVSKILLSSMNTLRAWLGNYAWAIVVLTLIIKTLMWPLQNKATNSMKKMQALQPKMTELREKYKDDPARMNTEVMGLYKAYGINPLGGCLPMLVQIPIFFGFYNMLGIAVELRNSNFLWVQDLSLPDTVATPFGFPLNILPLLMAGTMLFQMAIQPKSGDPMTQRMMMFMPLIFVIFCYNFASALALYWTVQNLFSIVQLYATRNQAPPVLVKAAPIKKKSRS